MIHYCLFCTYCGFIWVFACICVHLYCMVWLFYCVNVENSHMGRQVQVICVPFHGFLTEPTKARLNQKSAQHNSINQHRLYIQHTHFLTLPATLATLSASWLFAPLDRLGLRCLAPPGAERMLRRCTSVALKKATMKGCLFWGPLRPISPATRGLMLSPVGGDKESSTTGVGILRKDREDFIHTWQCTRRKGIIWKQINAGVYGLLF